MNRILTQWLMLAVLLVAWSCAPQVEVAPVTAVAATAEEQAVVYLAGSRIPPVLFQVAIHNEETGLFSGFLIDQQGAVRSYSLREAPYEFQQYRITRVGTDALRQLSRQATAEAVRLDPADLATRVRAIAASRDHQLTVRGRNPQASETIAFYTYAYPEEHLTENGCSAGNYSQEEGATFVQVPLQIEGKVNALNEAGYATGNIRWLTQLLTTIETK